MFAATEGVEFSFGGYMFKQIDGVGMGSPLGLVLANIFIGYHESRLFQSILHQQPEWYKQTVDNTFGILNGYSVANSFLDPLNNLRPSLKFACEYDKDDKLPFLDVLVQKEDTTFMTCVYRRPIFTGLQWRSYRGGRGQGATAPYSTFWVPFVGKIGSLSEILKRTSKVINYSHV